MEPKFRSSFIPKKSPNTTKKVSVVPVERHRSFNIVNIVGTLAFIIAILVAAGIFGYQFYIKNSISEKGVQLRQARDVINFDQVETYKKLDARIRLAERLFSNHVAATVLFDFLEIGTVKNIQYTTFNFEAGKGDAIKVRARGVARSFNTLAHQSDIFRDSALISAQELSNFSLNDRGDVIFNMVLLLNIEELRYKALFSERVE